MEKVLENHTCGYHIWRDEKKRLKNIDLDFFENDSIDSTQIHFSHLLERGQPML